MNFKKTLITLGVLLSVALVFIIDLLVEGEGFGVQKSILIQRGMTARQVTELLRQENVVQSPNFFRVLLRLTGANRRLRAGEFIFHERMRPLKVVNTLYLSDPVLHSITVPEGSTIRQIADTLTQKSLVNSKKFLDFALSPASAAKYGLKSPHLEGFLFPETYRFSKIDGEEKIIEVMVRTFLTRYEMEYKPLLQNSGMTLEQVVTLASIVEKETGRPDERPLIASVFHNRLRKKMRLQSDPTIIYGLSDTFKGNLTKKDLLTSNPYNTYTIPGLPPGPIANPGNAAILATLTPAKTNFLYFVSQNNGSHVFSARYSDHARNVSQFQPLIPNKKLKKKRARL